MLDQKSLSILEFDKIRELVAAHTSFSGGRELALAMQPTTELEQAREWQAETREAVSLFGELEIHVGLPDVHGFEVAIYGDILAVDHLGGGAGVGEPRHQVAGGASGEDFFLAGERRTAGVAVSVLLVVGTTGGLRNDGPLRRKRMQRC